jgi:hypothetical protein
MTIGRRTKAKCSGWGQAPHQAHLWPLIVADRRNVEIAEDVDLGPRIKRHVEAAAHEHIALVADIGRARSCRPAREAVLSQRCGHLGEIGLQKVANVDAGTRRMPKTSQLESDERNPDGQREGASVRSNPDKDKVVIMNLGRNEGGNELIHGIPGSRHLAPSQRPTSSAASPSIFSM